MDRDALITKTRLLTTTASVLAAIVDEPGATMRDLARHCDKTERVVWQQVRQLEEAGLLQRRRRGRRNHYVVDLPAVERQLQGEAAVLFSRYGLAYA